jgi:hypothetical protein
MNSMGELERLFLEQTKKLGALSAALGVAGDEPIEVLKSHAKQIVVERRTLLSAAKALCESAQPSLGTVHVSSIAFRRLSVLVHGTSTPA